jgi:hypothetical protein
MQSCGPRPSPGLAAQDVSTDPSEIDKTIEDLQHISIELNHALKTLEADLDDAIAHYDDGYRVGRLHIPAADAELTSGDANVKRTDVRKLIVVIVNSVFPA